MSLVFVDSFDHYATANIKEKYSRVGSAGATVSATYGRNGNGISRIAGADANEGWGWATPAVSEIIVGQAFKRGAGAAGHVICCFVDVTAIDLRTHISVNYTAAGQIAVYRGTSNRSGIGSSLLATSVLNCNPDIWNYCEVKVKIDAVDGYVIVKINEVEYINYTGNTANTSLSAPYVLGSINWYLISNNPQGPVSNGINLDDIYVCSVTGAKNSDFLGDVKVEVILPDGAGGNTTWTPDSGNNWDRVNDAAPDGDTSYVETATINNKDSYTFTNLVSTNVAIPGIQINYYSKKTDSGGALYKALQREAGVDHLSTQEESVPTQYGFQTFPLDSSLIDGNDWSEAEINAIEVGMQRTG